MTEDYMNELIRLYSFHRKALNYFDSIGNSIPHTTKTSIAPIIEKSCFIASHYEDPIKALRLIDEAIYFSNSKNLNVIDSRLNKVIREIPIPPNLDGLEFSLSKSFKINSRRSWMPEANYLPKTDQSKADRAV